MADVLVIVAHPDDESLFAGGTIATITAQKMRVRVIALSDGETSRGAGARAVKRRRKQFAEACAILGAEHTALNVFPDQQSDTVPQLSINKAVEKAIAGEKPRRILTHHVGDLNLDHRRTAEAVLVATRRLDARIYSMTPEYPARCVGPAFIPTEHWGLSRKQFETKLRACASYVDEIKTRSYVRESRTEYFMEIR